MCGIAGIWHLDRKPLSQEKLQRFTDSLAHRGPDASSYRLFNNETVGLGHRRLSIFDLSPNGNQPMGYAGERYHIIYNGEVFNFLELKRELEAKNYTFRNQSDTEVILAAYDHWGVDCLKKFNGMWAFCIWDEQEKTMFLARDRFGIKPLYYHFQQNKLLAFASETIAFKYLGNFDRRFNRNNLSYDIASPFGLEASGNTIYEGINQVLPGHYIKLDASSGCRQKRWWNTRDERREVEKDYCSQVSYFRELFLDAVKLRLRSDVPLASALSGGLDSTAVYCAIYEMMKKGAAERTPADWQRAFVSTFPGSFLDERKYAEEVINFTGGKATYIEPDFSNLADKITASTSLFDSISISPILVASEVYRYMSREGYKVSMDGHGVDEMLFGYPSMIETVYRRRPDPELLNTILEMYSPADRARVREGLTVPGADPNNTFMRRLKQLVRKNLPDALLVQMAKKGLGGNEFGLIFKNRLPSVSSDPYQASSSSDDESISFQAFHTGILPSILRNFDRASMQNGIEIRMPFMDYRLVSYVFSLPFSSKVGGGYSKRIVRDAMKGMIPESIRTRTWKIGFNAPLSEWFNGPLNEFVMDEIHSPSFHQNGIWNGKKLEVFAASRCKNRSWNWNDSISFWPYLNAHILIKNNKQG